MKLSRRVRANRANAKRSTGPKTAEGKAKSAKNALRHGLAVSLAALDGFDTEIEQLASMLAGERANDEQSAFARQIAAAQLDLARVRRARLQLLEDAKARLSPPRTRDLFHAIQQYEATLDKKQEEPDEAALNVYRTISGFGPDFRPVSLTDGFAVLAPALQRLERYERRALSRRREAIRAFDAAAPVRAVDSHGAGEIQND